MPTREIERLVPERMQQPRNSGHCVQYQQVAQPVILERVPAPRSYLAACSQKCEGFLGNASIILGALQILIGVLCIILNSIEIAILCVTAEFGQGIWCGIPFIVTGAFAVLSGKIKTLCTITTLCVLSLLSASFWSPLLAVSARGLFSEEYNHHYYEYDFIMRYSEYIGCMEKPKIYGRKAVQILLVILALVEAIIAIVCASLCSRVVCCYRCSTRGQPQYSQAQATGTQAPPGYQTDSPPEYNPEFVKQKV